MSLELSLVIKGDQAGARKALEDTASGIEALGNKARGAAEATSGIGEAVDEVATKAPEAAAGVDELGEAASSAGGKFGTFKALAIGAIGGIAGALATAGLQAALGAAVGAAKDYFDELTNSADNVKDDLAAHKELIASIKGLWAEAEGAASSYGLVSAAGLRLEARSNVGRLDSDFGTALGRLSMGETLNAGGFGAASAGARQPFEAAISAFRKDLRDGRADVIAFREEVARIADALPAGSEAFKFAEGIMGDTQQAAQLQAELQRAVDLYRALTGDAAAAETALGKAGEEMRATGAEAAGALPALREYSQLLATIGGVTVTGPDGTRVTGQPGAIGGSFAQGGFTGHGPADRIAGVVHGGEFVFDAAATAAIGVANLEAIRRGVRGYASGGPVGTAGTGAGGGFGSLAADLFSLKDAIREFGAELWRTRSPIQAFASVLMSVSQNYLNKALGAAGDAVMTAFGFASGTDNSPGGWAMIGEAGPELVRLPRGSGVVAADRTRELVRGGDTNNFYISTPSPRAFAESRSSVVRAAAGLVGSSRRHV